MFCLNIHSIFLEYKNNEPGVRIAWSSQTYEPKKMMLLTRMFPAPSQMENGLLTRYIRALAGLGNLIRFKSWYHFVIAGPKRAPINKKIQFRYI